ncbi:MAG: sensor histidine kinase [Acetobacteraceae bacterium]|nr:sensor histidine kinase [Acetobacteraceae bacterium]MBV8524826.1 sensor histidine kinase [Acetobacteraceae bacterium]
MPVTQYLNWRAKLVRLVLGSVPRRLIALLALAAIPVAAMAGLIAWHNYQISVDRVREQLLLARETAAASMSTALEGVEASLASVAQAPVVRSADLNRCREFLAAVLVVNPARFSDLLVIDPEGQIRCSARGQIASDGDQPWVQAMLDAPREPTDANDLASGARLIAFGFPILNDAVFQGVLAARVRVAWLADQTRSKASGLHLWLVVPGRGLLPLEGATSTALPGSSVLNALLGSSAALLWAPSTGGQRFGYGITGIRDGMAILAGIDADTALTKARERLVRLLAGLGSALLAGVLAVGLGTHYAVVRPLRRLTAAIRRWRTGDEFRVKPDGAMPAEIDEMRRAFQDAVSALADRETALRCAIAQQDLLMQEIHHRVKNNLQVVASLLNLQGNRIRGPEARAEFQAARDRVRALATLHRHLYARGDLHSIQMPGFLRELCDQLFQAMGETPGNRIQLHIEAQELRISSDQAVPLSLIVTEALSNALKYAFPGGRSGSISVRLTADSDAAHFVIADNGVGIPAGPAEAETGIRDGLGIQLIRGFIRQLGASLRIEQGDGTRYIIDLPLRRDQLAPELEQIIADRLRSAA